MRNKLDQIAKALLGTLMPPAAVVEIAREIPGQVLVADLWVESIGAHANELARLGALGTMIGLGPCLLEPFSKPPGVREVRSCMLEQLSLDHHLFREATREKRPELTFPKLWIISSGRPETAIDAMQLQPMEGWPAGFWQSLDFYAFYLVVARDLPKIPDTLFLRLLGRGPTLRQAVRELATNPEHAWAFKLLRHVLVAYRLEIEQDPEEEEDMEALREVEAIYEEWEKRTKEAGEKTGLTESIEMLCSAFDIEISDERRMQLEDCDIPRLKEVFAALSTTRRWPEL